MVYEVRGRRKSRDPMLTPLLFDPALTCYKVFAGFRTCHLIRLLWWEPHERSSWIFMDHYWNIFRGHDFQRVGCSLLRLRVSFSVVAFAKLSFVTSCDPQNSTAGAGCIFVNARVGNRFTGIGVPGRSPCCQHAATGPENNTIGVQKR